MRNIWWKKKFCETSGTSDCALCTISSLGKLDSKFDQNFWQNPGRTFRSLDMEISLWSCITGFWQNIPFQTSNNTCLRCFLRVILVASQNGRFIKNRTSLGILVKLGSLFEVDEDENVGGVGGRGWHILWFKLMKMKILDNVCVGGRGGTSCGDATSLKQLQPLVPAGLQWPPHFQYYQQVCSFLLIMLHNTVSDTLSFKFDYFGKALCVKTRSPTRESIISA